MTSALRGVGIAATPVALLVLLILVAAPAPAAAHPNDPENKAATKCPGVKCQCGFTVTGKVVFVGDMLCMNTDGLKVGANNTTIDLNGFRLQCTDPVGGFRDSCQGSALGDDFVGDDAEVGIDTDGFSYVEIKGGGSIMGFDVGVWIPSGVHITVHKLNITGPDAVGGFFSTLDMSMGNRPETRGILIENIPCHCGGPDVLIRRNSVDNHTTGVLLNATNCTQIESNFIHDNNQGSQDLSPGEAHGISLLNAQANKIYDNLMVDNGINQRDDAAVGLFGPSTKFNRLANNNISYNNGFGILARGGATANRISKNVLNLNTSTETVPSQFDPMGTGRVFFDLADDQGGNTWESNNACETESGAVPTGVCNPGETAPPPTP